MWCRVIIVCIVSSHYQQCLRWEWISTIWLIWQVLKQCLWNMQATLPSPDEICDGEDATLSPVEQQDCGSTMTIKGQTPRRPIAAIKSSSEARRVIDELLTSKKSSQVSGVIESTEEVLQIGGNALVPNEPGKSERFAESAPPTAAKRYDQSANGDSMPRNSIPRNSVRAIAGRILERKGPRRSKSESHINISLPELGESQRSTSMTQLVTLSPGFGLPQQNTPAAVKQPVSLLRVAIANDMNEQRTDLDKQNVKSPGYYIRKQHEEPYEGQYKRHAQRQRSKRNLSTEQQSLEAKFKSRSEDCLVQMGKHRKAVSKSTAKRCGAKGGVNFSPGSERRQIWREPTMASEGLNAVDTEQPRSRAVRERSFDMTGLGYDVRYDVQIDLPLLSDMEKEVEADFKRKAVDKCRKWMNRWMPLD